LILQLLLQLLASYDSWFRKLPEEAQGSGDAVLLPSAELQLLCCCAVQRRVVLLQLLPCIWNVLQCYKTVLEHSQHVLCSRRPTHMSA
jgi:hypothetical protein